MEDGLAASAAASTATQERDTHAMNAQDSGLLVLDEFLSFVDEVGDVVGVPHEVPPSKLGFTAPLYGHTQAYAATTGSVDSPAYAAVTGLQDLMPLDADARTSAVLFDQRDAEAIYVAAMDPYDHEDEDESTGSPVPTSPEPWPTERNTQPVKEKKKRRRRQKEELDYLRVRVKEMEDELTRLRGEDIASSAVAVGTAKALHLLPATTIDLLVSGDESDDGESGDHGQQKSQRLWERIASHQKEETQKAVMENIKLRAMLEGQISIARTLESALRKKPRFGTAELHPYVGKGSTIRVEGEDEERIYESIGLDLDVQYAQVDAVLQSSGLVNVRREALLGAEVRADETGMFLEHREVRIVPFAVHAVGRAVWQTLSRQSMPLRNGVYISRDATDDTVCAKIVDTFRLPKATAETVVTIRLVLKRFVEENRVVSVWESVVETVGPVCMRLREKAWNVLTRHYVDGDAVHGGERKEMCIAHSIIRVWPEIASTESGQNTEVGTLTNLVVGSYQRNLGIMAQIIQGLLSEEANKRRTESGDLP